MALKEIISMKNVGKTDSMIRYGLAAGLVMVGLVLGYASTISIVLYVVAVVLAVTASVSVCPIYLMLGIKTNSKK
jgi:type IV secretory pathway TrbD component